MLKCTLAGLVTLFFVSCVQLFDVGPNTFIKESYNLQGSKKAIIFLKGGNATADNSLQISIAGYDHQLDNKEVGNTFTVDSGHGKTVQDSNAINLTWLSNDTLQIHFDHRLRTFTQNKLVNGVTVIYKTK